MLTPWKESYDQPRQHIKKQRHYFANKGLSSQGYGFSSGHVWMWELDHKESWALKNWCFWTVVLEKTLESPLDCKEIQPVHRKGVSLTPFRNVSSYCWVIGVTVYILDTSHFSDVCIANVLLLTIILTGCSPWGHKELDMTKWLSNDVYHKACLAPGVLLLSNTEQGDSDHITCL